jgi:hypothetical protein
VNENGVISFDEPFNVYFTTCLPFIYEDYTPRKLLALFWADHKLTDDGAIYYRSVAFHEEEASSKIRIWKLIRKNFFQCAKNFKPKRFIFVTYHSMPSWEGTDGQYEYEPYPWYEEEDEEHNYYDYKRDATLQKRCDKSNEVIKMFSSTREL